MGEWDRVSHVMTVNKEDVNLIALVQTISLFVVEELAQLLLVVNAKQE